MTPGANMDEQTDNLPRLYSGRLSPNSRLIVFDGAPPRLGLRMGNLFMLKMFREGIFEPMSYVFTPCLTATRRVKTTPVDKVAFRIKDKKFWRAGRAE